MDSHKNHTIKKEACRECKLDEYDKKNKIKSSVAIATGFIACPCHLPVTLPLAIALLSGTALGAWINGNQTLIYIIFIIYFIFALAYGVYLMKKRKA